jgi:hypothetical protein
MGVIAHQRPCVDGSARVFSQCPEAGDEIVAILVVVHNLTSLNATHNDMV